MLLLASRVAETSVCGGRCKLLYLDNVNNDSDDSESNDVSSGWKRCTQGERPSALGDSQLYRAAFMIREITRSIYSSSNVC